LRARGLYAALMNQLGRRLGVHLFRVFHRRLGEAAPADAPQGFDLRVLSEAELIAHSADPELDLSEKTSREALRRGHVCVGAVAGEKLAGYVWFAYDSAPHVKGVWVDVPPQAIYRYKSFVRAVYRGRRIAPALYRFADAVVARPGREYVLDCIATHNFASIAASERSGGKTFGYLAYWQAGSRFVSYHSRSLKRRGFRFYLRRD
jgi:ribosomal protein S18 acetylase RimI-like enzyme